MSRSDGVFPHVTKIDIDPGVWPKNYYDKSQVCTECDEAWPATHLFRPSPCCDAPTKESDRSPDMRWPEAVSALLAARFERFYDEYNEGVSDEELSFDEQAAKQEVEQLIETTSRVDFATRE